MTLEAKIAIIASVSAIIGALISQTTAFVLARIDRKHKKNVLHRQKYEEMTLHFQESLNYYSQVGICRTQDQLNEHNHSSHAQKAMVLSLIYFPELVAVLENYIQHYTTYYHRVFSVFDETMKMNAGTQVRLIDKEFPAFEQQLFESKNMVLKLLTENAEKYNKA